MKYFRLGTFCVAHRWQQVADLKKQRFVTALAMTLGDGEKAAEAIGQMGYTLGDNPKNFLDQMGMTAGRLRNF